jgi:hypothetical protein
MPKHLPLPPLELLNKNFEIDYSSSSGLRWKINKGPRRAGDVAGSKTTRGYWGVGIKTDKSRIYRVHRIILYMETGIDPGEFIVDHYGKGPSDNAHIRLATQQLNCAYSKKQIRTSKGEPMSKYKGVTWFKKNKKWGAQIRMDGKNKFLGLYDCEKEAALRYNEEAIKRWKGFALINELSEEDIKEIKNFKKWQEENPSQTSRFRGVSWHKRVKKWVAKISINKKRIHLGVFNTEIEAAKAYNKAAIDTWGERAKLNDVD